MLRELTLKFDLLEIHRLQQNFLERLVKIETNVQYKEESAKIKHNLKVINTALDKAKTTQGKE